MEFGQCWNDNYNYDNPLDRHTEDYTEGDGSEDNPDQDDPCWEPEDSFLESQYEDRYEPIYEID